MSLNEQVITIPLLEEVITWEKEIAEQVPYIGEPSGLYLGIEGDGNGGYACSPIDAITFARTGMDGIHYAILTDFSANMDLEQAPVICISPMDFGSCVRVVARNMKDFFSLQLLGQATLLLNTYDSREHYMRHIRQEEEDQTSEYFDDRKWKAEKRIVAELAMQRFQLEPIADPYGYMEELCANRQREVVLRTADRLGVMAHGQVDGALAYEPHPWSGSEIPCDELDELESFLRTAATETKQAYVRDYQEQYIDDMDSMLLIRDELMRMGFSSEAKRLYDRVSRDTGYSQVSEHVMTTTIMVTIQQEDET